MIHIVRFIVNAIALYCIAHFGAALGFDPTVTVKDALIVALIFGIVNALIGPILRLIAWPVNFLTHGIFSVVVNYALFIITVAIAPHIAPSFRLSGTTNWWLADLWGAIIMMLVGTILQQIWKHPSEGSTQTA
ncbi:MAG TPA: phage holin family protein [Candidatus Tyrphobacter sp.]